MLRDVDRAADDLDRFLDDLSVHGVSDSIEVGPDLVAAAVGLRDIARRLSASTEFVARLEADLMAVPTTTHLADLTPALSSPNGRLAEPPPGWHSVTSRGRFWPLSEWPTAAVVLLIVFLGVAAYRLADIDGDDSAGITPATPTASPTVACEGPTRTAADFASLSGTPSAWGLLPLSEGRSQTVLLADHLPSGVPADPATVAEIEATVDRYWACAAAGDADRLAGLYSEDYWRRVILVLGTPEAWEFDLTPQPDWSFHPPVIRDARVLPDGRVGAIVVTTGETGATEEAFAIFVETEGGWLIDEIVAMVDPSAAAWPDSAGCRFEPRPAATPVPDTTRQLNANELLATEEAIHGPLPPGSPVSDATADDIVAVWQELWACLAAGDPSRAAALFTDDGLATLPEGFGSLALFLGLEVSNRYVELDEDRNPYPAQLLDVLLIEEGRIVAVFAPYAPWAVEYRVYFEQVDGRWIIDGIYRFVG